MIVTKPEEFFQGEVNDSYLYKQLASNEKDEKVREKLMELSEIEKGHSEFWASVIKEEGGSPVPKIKKIGILYLKFLKSLFGISFIINYLEKGEVRAIEDYSNYLANYASDEKKNKIQQIIDDEKNHESLFIKMSEEFSLGAEKTHDAIYGMSDGLIEVLAGIAGLTNVLANNIFILIGGIIFAISGMISMTIGAFLSEKAKIQISKNESKYTSLHAAGNTALFYFIGAIFPIIPFIFLPKYIALLVAVILTLAVDAIAASVISISSWGNIRKDVAVSVLLVTLGFLTTFAIGLVVHHFIGNIL